MTTRLFSYTPTLSPLHRMDAMSKFLWVFAASILPFIMWTWWQVVAEIALLFLLSSVFSNLKLKETLRSWLLFLGLGCLIVFFHVTNRHEGVLLAKIWFYAIHSDGVQLGLLFGLRVVAIMGSSFLFVRTTNPRDLVVALISFGLPYRYAWMLFIAMLSVPVFESEITVIKEAQAVRGIKPAANPIAERLQMYRRYMFPLLASALRRVENLAVAMDSRAFGAYSDRTFIDDFSWTASGLVFLTATVAMLVVVAVWRIYAKPGFLR